jgi:hypothetical protein
MVHNTPLWFNKFADAYKASFAASGDYMTVSQDLALVISDGARVVRLKQADGTTLHAHNQPIRWTFSNSQKRDKPIVPGKTSLDFLCANPGVIHAMLHPDYVPPPSRTPSVMDVLSVALETQAQ